MVRDPLHLSREVFERFADATGVTSDRPSRRYLWTDAFAVCGFLGLHVETGEERFSETARRLVDQVHHVLGRHREDDERSGRIGGLQGHEAEEHPAAGGLRIGKPEPERRTGEPYDPVREWSRDGQCYHCLTEWMHALNRIWRVTGEPRFHRWAVGLRAVERLDGLASGSDGADEAWLEAVRPSRPLAGTIEAFWAEPMHRAVPSWTEYEEINDVSLAVASRPAGYLDL